MKNNDPIGTAITWVITIVIILLAITAGGIVGLLIDSLG